MQEYTIFLGLCGVTESSPSRGPSKWIWTCVFNGFSQQIPPVSFRIKPPILNLRADLAITLRDRNEQ